MRQENKGQREKYRSKGFEGIVDWARHPIRREFFLYGLWQSLLRYASQWIICVGKCYHQYLQGFFCAEQETAALMGTGMAFFASSGHYLEE